jgi:hypothetical protein
MPLIAEPLRLAAPRAGDVLHGGGFATIQWSADALPPHAEEWEAFLSIDGGKYYAFRITRNARILIRTGDEKRETLFEIPERFTIVRDAHAEVQEPHASSGRAEAAREGDPVVIAWVDGDRAGSRVTQQVATPASKRIAASASDVRIDSPFAAPKTVRASIETRTIVASAPGSLMFSRAVDRATAQDLLLVCRRLNI